MKRDVQGTETEKNLMRAFVGEAMARNKYTFFSSVAKNEGYEQIAAIFEDTANNEKMHAKRFFTFLGTENIPIEISDVVCPTGLADTKTNLEVAIQGEHDENTFLYPNFADIAEKEGFEAIANCFRAIVQSEIGHEKRYTRLLENIKANKVFKKDEEVLWKCRKCGYRHFGKSAPKVCPACLHPMAYFEIYPCNY